MSVLITNASLGVRRRDTSPGRDAHGTPIPAGYGAMVGPLPGMTRERGEDGGWVLGLDPSLWPVREHDIVREPSANREWLVITASLLTNADDARVNWIRAEAHERKSGETEPSGAYFAAR